MGKIFAPSCDNMFMASCDNMFMASCDNMFMASCDNMFMASCDNMFMAKMEQDFFHTTGYQPHLYLRYFDDIFIFWRGEHQIGILSKGFQ